MSNTLITILALGSLTSAQISGICPTPFELTTTQGTLLSRADGTQFPAAASFNETAFQLSANSSLITASGASCQFAPWLVCDTSPGRQADQVTLSQDGTVSLAGRTNGSIFYACNPAALHNDQIPSSVTRSATPSTATSNTSSANTTVIEEYYIIPDAYHKLLPSYTGANGSCVQVTLQASRCYENATTTTSAAPGATHTASGASGLDLMQHLVRAGIVGAVLAVFFIGM